MDEAASQAAASKRASLRPRGQVLACPAAHVEQLSAMIVYKWQQMPCVQVQYAEDDDADAPQKFKTVDVQPLIAAVLTGPFPALPDSCKHRCRQFLLLYCSNPCNVPSSSNVPLATGPWLLSSSLRKGFRNQFSFQPRTQESKLLRISSSGCSFLPSL
jgi:hypothetical protein